MRSEWKGYTGHDNAIIAWLTRSIRRSMRLDLHDLDRRQTWISNLLTNCRRECLLLCWPSILTTTSPLILAPFHLSWVPRQDMISSLQPSSPDPRYLGYCTGNNFEVLLETSAVRWNYQKWYVSRDSRASSIDVPAQPHSRIPVLFLPTAAIRDLWAYPVNGITIRPYLNSDLVPLTWLPLKRIEFLPNQGCFPIHRVSRGGEEIELLQPLPNLSIRSHLHALKMYSRSQVSGRWAYSKVFSVPLDLSLCVLSQQRLHRTREMWVVGARLLVQQHRHRQYRCSLRLKISTPMFSVERPLSLARHYSDASVSRFRSE